MFHFHCEFETILTSIHSFACNNQPTNTFRPMYNLFKTLCTRTTTLQIAYKQLQSNQHCTTSSPYSSNGPVSPAKRNITTNHKMGLSPTTTTRGGEAVHSIVVVLLVVLLHKARNKTRSCSYCCSSCCCCCYSIPQIVTHIILLLHQHTQARNRTKGETLSKTDTHNQHPRMIKQGLTGILSNRWDYFNCLAES